MDVGLKIGLAATAGLATGAGIGALMGGEPDRASSYLLGAAGVGTTGLFAAVTRRGGPFTSQGFGLVGVAMGGLWAGVGAVNLLRSSSDGGAPANVPYNPAEHLAALPAAPRTLVPPAGIGAG